MQLARESVISAFRPLDPADVVLGQFDGYRQTEGIADDSSTDTYVAAKLWVDTDRWRDVPFVLRTGKRLQGGAQRLSLLFRTPEGPLHSAGKVPEVLAFDLEPADGTPMTPAVAGQYVSVQVTVPDGLRQPRQFTLVPSEPGHRRVVVREDPQG